MGDSLLHPGPNPPARGIPEVISGRLSPALVPSLRSSCSSCRLDSSVRSRTAKRGEQPDGQQVGGQGSTPCAYYPGQAELRCWGSPVPVAAAPPRNGTLTEPPARSGAPGSSNRSRGTRPPVAGLRPHLPATAPRTAGTPPAGGQRCRSRGPVRSGVPARCPGAERCAGAGPRCEVAVRSGARCRCGPRRGPAASGRAAGAAAPRAARSLPPAPEGGPCRRPAPSLVAAPHRSRAIGRARGSGPAPSDGAHVRGGERRRAARALPARTRSVRRVRTAL